MSTTEQMVSDAREALARAFQSVGSKIQAGDYLATIRKTELINSARGTSVRVEFEIDGQIVPQFFGLIDRNGKPLKGGIIGMKIMLRELGYDEEQFRGEGIEGKLEKAFAEITEAQPEVRLRLSYNGDFQNVRILEATGKEAK